MRLATNPALHVRRSQGLCMYISPFVEERGPSTTSVDIEIHSAPEKIESNYENTISDKLGIHVYFGQDSRLQRS